MPRISRSFVAAAALLASIALLLFLPLVLNPTGVLVGPQRGGWNDLTTYFIPIHDYPRQCVSEFGQWPWWNPYRSAGVPHVGNPQSALFYPPNWLCWGVEAAHALSWLIVLHHWWAGLGTYQLCRRYGLSWDSSVLAGSFFLGAPYLLAQSGEGHYAQLCVVAWMPWTVLAFERLRHVESGGIAGTAVTLAMGFFAGHAQELYYLVVILTAWIAVSAAGHWRRGDRRGAAELLGRWLLAGIVVLGLVAVDLLGIVVYARQTLRAGGLHAHDAGQISMRLVNLLQLLNPFALGGPQSYGGTDRFFWESLCSFGSVPLMLGCFGAIAARLRRDAAASHAVSPSGDSPAGTGFAPTDVLASAASPIQLTTRWGLTLLVALCFGFGASSPLFRIMFAVVPGVSFFRVPSRVLFFCSLAMAVLAAMGAEALALWYREWTDRVRQAARRTALAACAGMLLVAGAIKLSDRAAPAREPGGAGESVARRALHRSLGSSTAYAWLAGATGLVYAGMRYPRLAVHATRLLCVVGVVQLGTISSKLFRPLSVHEYRRPGLQRVTSDDWADGSRVLAAHEFFPPLGPLAQQAWRVQAYDPVPLVRYAAFFAALLDKSDPTPVLVGYESPAVAKLREPLVDVLSVRWIVLHGGQRAMPERFAWEYRGTETVQPFRLEGAVGARPATEGSLYENLDALPRAYVVGQTKLVPRRSDAIGALADLDPRRELVMTAEFLPPGPRADFAAARITEYSPNRVVVEVELPAVGYVVLSDNWYPGWQATDNGMPTSVIPANVSFRAVPLAPGHHRVEFRFRPPGLAIGGIVSGLAWCALAVAILSARRRAGR